MRWAEVGKAATTKALAPGEGERLDIVLDPALTEDGVHVTLGGKASVPPLDECREDNNQAFAPPGCR